MKKFHALAIAGALACAMPIAAQAYCNNCGKVLKIETVTGHRSSAGGAVAGAVIGGVIGNQFGSGDGKTAMTVAGTVGGAVAGKQIAENSQKMKYRITVRMEDGEIETVVQSKLRNLHVGDSVRVHDGKAEHY